MIGGAIAVNLVLVAIVYVALAYGAVTGLLAADASAASLRTRSPAASSASAG